MKRLVLVGLTITYLVLAPALFFGGFLTGMSSFEQSPTFLPKDVALPMMIIGGLLALPTAITAALLQDLPGAVIFAYLLHLPWSYLLARISVKIYDSLKLWKASRG